MDHILLSDIVRHFESQHILNIFQRAFEETILVGLS